MTEYWLAAIPTSGKRVVQFLQNIHRIIPRLYITAWCYSLLHDIARSFPFFHCALDHLRL